MNSVLLSLSVAAALILSPHAEARRSGLPEGVTTYSADFEGWKEAAPGFTTLDFTGFEAGTTLYDQYLDLGVLFTSPGPPKITYAPSALLQDGWGVDGNWPYIELTFLMPMYAVAWHHNPHKLKLYNGDELVAETPVMGFGGEGQKFGGVTSTIAFDRVRIQHYGSLPGDQVWVDNIYFAAASVPAPGAAMVLAALIMPRGGRRREKERTRRDQ